MAVKFISPQIVSTADGSESLYLPELEETYHSHHGALQESIHVYIKAGLAYASANGCMKPRIFELGLGTFLNAFITLAYAENNGIELSYYGIEKYPVEPQALLKMNYATLPGLETHSEYCKQIVNAEWEEEVKITPNFKLFKKYGDFLTFEHPENAFDVFYFDAFGFRAQSEMWSVEVFKKCFEILAPGGILVTYAAKGIARRNMESVGFKVERLKGAPGKREMMRATKPLE